MGGYYWHYYAPRTGPEIDSCEDCNEPRSLDTRDDNYYCENGCGRTCGASRYPKSHRLREGGALCGQCLDWYCHRHFHRDADMCFACLDESMKGDAA